MTTQQNELAEAIKASAGRLGVKGHADHGGHHQRDA